MALTTAMFTGLSGLSVNQAALDVIGNNIANVNTTAFKGSRVLMQPNFSETSSFGTPPSESFGGTNPMQVGLGAKVTAVQRDFNGGSIRPTGLRSDVAIEGQGMFVVEQDGQQLYTRNGTFLENEDKYLTNAEGRFVMGYAVDQDFNLVPGNLTRIRIPLYETVSANATTSVKLGGRLGNETGPIATQASVIETFTELSLLGGGPVTEDSYLTELREGDDTIFEEGDELTFRPSRGGRTLAESNLNVTAGTTVGDFMEFLVNTLGINTDPSLSPAPGAQIVDQGGTYAIRITGNVGEQNALQIDPSDLSSTSTTRPMPLMFSTVSEANGASAFTSTELYDSLGNPISMNITFALESRDNSGSIWRFFANSEDDTDPSNVLGTGTVRFDTNGQFVSSTNTTFTIDRDGTGAVTPQSVTWDMSRMQGLARTRSEIGVLVRNGNPAGTLTDYAIGEDGSITGTFENGTEMMLGQIALATFSNYAGLVDVGDNIFKAGPNSGVPMIGAPLSGGAGRLIGGALETSNIDISREFIDMIIASTGFSASSRIITTSNQLLTELMAVMR